MISQPPKKKGFFAKYWGLLLAGCLVLGLLMVGVAVGGYFLLRTNVQATSIVLSMDKPEYGKPLSAKVELENKGLLSADYEAALLVDNNDFGSDEISLDSKESGTVTFDLKGLAAGKHTLSIAGKDEEFTVYLPAKFTVVGIEVDEKLVIVGEPAIAKVTVKNSGELPGDFESELALDGKKTAAIKGTVEAGAEIVLDVEFTADDRGAHTLTVDNKTCKIDVVTPAHIEVTNLVLSNTYPKPNESVTAKVTVKNSGDLAGSYTVVLNVNGADEQQQSVTVEPGSTLDVSFSLTKSKAGSYTIKSGDSTKSMRVVVITRPKNGTFLISSVKATNTNSRLGYMQLYNNYKDKDVMFVLARRDNPKVAVLAVYVRAGQNVMRFYVKNTSDYIGYYTCGGSFDSSSRRFLYSAEYYKYPDSVDFDYYWYTFYMPNKGYTKIDATQFPK